MWRLDARSALPVWHPVPSPPGVRMAFSTRRGGISQAPYDALNLGRSTRDRLQTVDRNRHLILTALGLDPTRLATAGQVHGATVARARAPGLHPACDALVTT